MFNYQYKSFLLCVSLIITLPTISIASEFESFEEMPKLKSHYEQKIESALMALNSKNYDDAYRRLSTTARWGDKTSQFYLSIMYLQGQGTPQDIKKAWIWLNVALEERNSDWLVMKRKLKKLLPDGFESALKTDIEKYKKIYGVKAQGLSCRKEKAIGSNRLIEKCRKSWVH